MIYLKTKESQRELILLIAAGLAFGIVGWMLTVAPILNKLASVRQEAITARERSVLIPELEDLRMKHQKTGALFLEEGKRNDFLDQISALASENSINLESLVPTTEPAEPYNKLTLNLKTRTSYLLLIKFLEKLDELKPVVVISSMSSINELGRMRRDLAMEAPSVELTLETYVKKKVA
ncbi:MAG: hypothetical protein HYS55_01610 [Candidatus Omnitrophica bacterium]|nr:hypothetical protein [Candidatus Omnitrophota bacterium]